VHIAFVLLAGLIGCAPIDASHHNANNINEASCRPTLWVYGEGLIRECTSVIQSPNITAEERALAYFYRATAWLNQDQPGLALLDLDHAIQLDRNVQRVFLARCEAYVETAEPDLAIRDCDESLRRTPIWNEAYDYRGKAYAAKGQYWRAIRDFDEAIRLNPNVGAWYRDRGFACRALGQPAKAAADFARAKRTPQPRPPL
jgi:tetratricopeptide (TPR) repeat protein